MAKSNAFELEALNRDACGLRVRFERAGDNYRQSIDAIVSGASSPLLTTNSSPPFQEIVSSTHRDSPHSSTEWPALLLTGAGDRTYWSAAVIVVADQRLAFVRFDFACRMPPGAALPEIAFSASDGVDAEQRDEDEDDNVIVLHTSRDTRYWLSAGNAPVHIPGAAEIESHPTCRLSLDESQITIRPMGAPRFMTGPTVRWSFEISLALGA